MLAPTKQAECAGGKHAGLSGEPALSIHLKLLQTGLDTEQRAEIVPMLRSSLAVRLGDCDNCAVMCCHSGAGPDTHAANGSRSRQVSEASIAPGLHLPQQVVVAGNVLAVCSAPAKCTQAGGWHWTVTARSGAPGTSCSRRLALSALGAGHAVVSDVASPLLAGVRPLRGESLHSRMP